MLVRIETRFNFCLPVRVATRMLTTLCYDSRSIPKAPFGLPRANDPRAGHFAAYREESKEFDGYYVRKYDKPPNISLAITTCLGEVYLLEDHKGPRP